MTPGYTLDIGALIALERKNGRMTRAWHLAIALQTKITVPTVVIAEWWRGRSKTREHLLRSVTIEELSAHTAQLAGEALAAVKHPSLPPGQGPSIVAAIVAASAAQRGDVIYTSDVDDLEQLRTHFRSIARVLQA